MQNEGSKNYNLVHGDYIIGSLLEKNSWFWFWKQPSRAVEPSQGCCYIVFAINKFQENVQPEPTQ